MNFKCFKRVLFGVFALITTTAFSQITDATTKSNLEGDSQIIKGIKNSNKNEVNTDVAEVIDGIGNDTTSTIKSIKPANANEELTEIELAEKKLKEEAAEIRRLKDKIAKLEQKTVVVKNEPKTNLEKGVFAAPSTKFDLSDWSLSVPSDKDNNGKADQIKEKQLSKGFANEYFYIGEDGGMVFTCPIKGFKTSKNTSYTRSELREMLRAGNTKIKTKGPNENNWVLKASNSMYTAGGYNGQLNAKLAVNYVTTTGVENQVGRVIIGQIHAQHNEPLRIYYRKLPNNSKGSIYFAHEGRDNNKEDYYELIGSKSSKAKDPENGIALNEPFSYQVLVLNNDLTVKIIKEDKSIFEKTIDISKSGYENKDEYMYFKAGVYNQNKTGEPDDYVQATFYELENKHQKYVEPTYDD